MRDTKQDVLHFWFDETEPVQWFQKNDDFDRLVAERFQVTVTMAQDGLCDAWASDADGALALCIVLDQFPRNIYRNLPGSFASDDKALRVAKAAIRAGFDQILPPLRRRFIYLPFEHSESADDQDRSVALFATMQTDDPIAYEYALRHRDVIRRFGRFPHRNAILGRQNTADEQLYLTQPGAGF